MIYTRQFIWPMAQFGRIINNYQRAKASSERIYGLMHELGRLADGDDTDLDGGGVTFEGVTFGYDDDPVVADVDLRAEEGETIGLVGPTGAGKSTLLKLLIRMYDPDEGAVRIGGTVVREVSLENLRESIGYVSQEPFLFGGSVKENIAYGSSTRPTRRSGRPPGPPGHTSSSPICPRGMERPSASAGCNSRAGSANVSRSPGRSLKTPKYSCSTRRRATSIPKPKR
jgi:hypothetical protein